MTNEEARIELLEEYKIFLEGCGLENEEYLNQQMKDNDELRKVVEANRMAIKALEQQPSDDCISRKAVIDHINLHPYVVGNRSTLVLQIKTLPSVTPIISQKETVEDCISRKSVDKIINKWLSHPDYELKDNIYDMTKMIHKLPSVTPKAEWIHVSERLPKAGEYIGDVAKYYLVQNEYGDMLVARYTHSEYWEQIYQLKPIKDKIVAWMPLPEPYKEEESDGK